VLVFLLMFYVKAMVLFYAHCVSNINISASVSKLNSGNVIQFGASDFTLYLYIVSFALCYYSQRHCDYSVTEISSSLIARCNIDMQIFLIVFLCVDCFTDYVLL